MTAESLLNAWIDANLLLGGFALLWLAVRRLLSRGTLRGAFIGQSRVLGWVMVAVIAAPLLSRVVSTWGLGQTPNLSDILVAHYLSGNVDMSAARFEYLLGLREDLVAEFLLQRGHWARFALAIVVTGAAISFALLVSSVLRLRRVLSRAHLWRQFGRLRLVVSDDVRVPFSTRGLRHRYIVLPGELLGDGRDLKLTLAHEFQHFRQNDLAFEFAVELLKPLFICNPAFFVWRRQLRELREFSCDQALLRRRPELLRRYCRCLIRASQRARSAPVRFIPTGPAVAFVGAAGASGAHSLLGRRILALTDNRGGGDGRLVWALVGGGFCAALVLSALVMQKPGDWSHDRIMLATIVNLERLSQRNATVATVLPAE